jgi:aryl-alcohol dehydrogenase-like predicted oxidoreductase
MAQDQRTLSSINLGQGLQVSEQGLGCMSVSGVYGSADDAESLRMVNHALDIGVTFLDTANIYGAGHSETLLSRVLKTRRDEVTLATKAGIVRPKNPGEPRANGDPAFIKKCLDESLMRLGVDEVDLYYYHRVDSRVPIEETVGAYAELLQAGKIKHIGLSEVTTHELQRAHQVHPITAIQMEYSLFSRDIEKWLLPAASELGVGVVPYASLGRGFFNGAAESLEQLPKDDIRHNFPRFAAENIVANLALRDEIFSIARNEKITPGQLSLAWVYEQGRKFNVAMAPIPGTRYTSHVDENVSASSLKLSSQALQDLNELAGRVAGERQKDIYSVSKGREEQQMSTR